MNEVEWYVVLNLELPVRQSDKAKTKSGIIDEVLQKVHCSFVEHHKRT